MSLNVSGEKCVLCGAYLFEDDDIVYCPDCGAPHHRECYHSAGHCALSELHGTDKQYQRTQQNQEKPNEDQAKNTIDGTEAVCRMCGAAIEKEASSCPKCGAPNISQMGGRFMRFDFLGGVPANMDLGNGVTAEEAKNFVFSNSQRYIPKFAGFKSGKKASWNWAAFLFPCAWFLSRKMKIWGVLIGALQIAFGILLFPFVKAMNQFDFAAKTYSEIAKLIADNMSTIGVAVLITAVVGIFLTLLLRVICGIFGDLIYRNHAISEIPTIKESSIDKNEALNRKGGVSLIAALLGIMAIEYLPTILASLIGIY